MTREQTGNGCFFHVQHVMVTEFEEAVLERSGNTTTSVASYAGGVNATRLCYHNADNASDYGLLGHAEVVALQLDSPAQLQSAAEIFFRSFVKTGGFWGRQDIFDQGQEYRAVIGMPAGSTWFEAVQTANSKVHNMTLVQGKGQTDPDTLFTNKVYLLDSSLFPPTQAELCLQFHDDNPSYSPPYSQKYHELLQILQQRGRLKHTSCPKNFIC